MRQKPSDLLEFLRQAHDDEPAPVQPLRPPPGPGRTVPMVVLRRSQVTVAAVAAGLGLILVFLLGLGLGGSGDEVAATPIGQTVWGIRVVSYKDTDTGRIDAQITQNQLRQLDLDEVTVQRIASQGLVVVMVGSWLTDPKDNSHAVEILSKVQNLSARGKNRAFPDASFWSIQR